MGILRMKHKSVLLKESIDNLNIKVDGVYVDATLGFGGHSLEILKRINKGFLFAFDQDSEAIQYSTERLKDFNNFKIIKSNFANMRECLNKEGINKVDGILFDIGVSSMQLDEDYRGFSYHNDARLDMRMDTDSDFSAYEELKININQIDYYKITVDTRNDGTLDMRFDFSWEISNRFEVISLTDLCPKLSRLMYWTFFLSSRLLI